LLALHCESACTCSTRMTIVLIAQNETKSYGNLCFPPPIDQTSLIAVTFLMAPFASPEISLGLI
jgi:hypothetical protein